MVFGYQFVFDIDQIAKISVPLIAQFAVMPGRRDRAKADQLILAGVAAAKSLLFYFGADAALGLFIHSAVDCADDEIEAQLQCPVAGVKIAPPVAAKAFADDAAFLRVGSAAQSFVNAQGAVELAFAF